MRLLVFVLVAELLLPLSARSETLSEVPFQYRDGLIWLKVELAGRKGPLNFLLDSGAGASVLDLARARALGLGIGNPETVQGVNGYAPAYRVNDFHARCGSITVPKSLLAVYLQALSDCCHQPIDGILGVDFFRGRIVQIDFAAGKVRLLEHCDMDLANCEILPIKKCNDAFCIPLGVAGNRREWIRLDTGCDAALEWVASESEKKRPEPTSIGLSHSSARCIRTSVQIGKRQVIVPVVIHEKQIFSGERGLLGNGLLAEFRVTVDLPGNRVIFENRK
jgi:Aspartyl protease